MLHAYIHPAVIHCPLSNRRRQAQRASLSRRHASWKQAPPRQVAQSCSTLASLQCHSMPPSHLRNCDMKITWLVSRETPLCPRYDIQAGASCLEDLHTKHMVAELLTTNVCHYCVLHPVMGEAIILTGLPPAVLPCLQPVSAALPLPVGLIRTSTACRWIWRLGSWQHTAVRQLCRWRPSSFQYSQHTAGCFWWVWGTWLWWAWGGQLRHRQHTYCRSDQHTRLWGFWRTSLRPACNWATCLRPEQHTHRRCNQHPSFWL